MIELGKHDILQRRSLPMEPFGRNASFRALDLSLDGFPKERVGRYVTSLFFLCLFLSFLCSVQRGHLSSP